MLARKLLAPPLVLLALAAPAGAAEPRVAREVTARLDAGESSVRVLVAVRGGAKTPAAPGFTARRPLRRGVAGSVTRAGLAALRASGDVEAIVLDGTVRPAGQVGASQIGADRLLSLGLDGTGRSVAVVDTGIDTTSVELGGAPVPNAKVIGGWNFVTASADVSDCGGHGTQVAGVVAGKQGVAPGASLVVLKVFGGSSGCEEALYSDVLAAVEWAIDNRERYRIEAVNLSLSGDVLRAGFCDTEDPVSAAVFREAREAGIGVLAASGNDGRPDGITWPACFSDVAAVGMVYSGSVGGYNWDGTASCQDRITGADIVPCASNSGSALSLLAPGVRWVTTAPGGSLTQSFSGTSAAAPAAAGAYVLARQARPERDPALVLDQLRATGVPVVDDKNGRTGPRVDLGAAADATTPATGPCDDVSIPDARIDGLLCTAEVSSLATNVSSLAVALSIDHPDPTQLVVSLTGPDGTSVVLMNRGGAKGHALREVFGRTAVPLEPLSSFAGRPAWGTWTLSVVDTIPGLKGRLVSWALQIEPEAAPAAPAVVARTAVVPTSVHGAGRFGSFFTTDLRLFNTDAFSPRTATVRLRASSGAPDRSVTVTVPPHGTRVLSDVLGDVFRTTDYGPLLLDAPPAILAGTRTTAAAAGGGRYGLYVPAVAAGNGITSVTPSLTLLPHVRGGSFRVNVGATEMSGAAVTAELTIRDARGVPKARVPFQVRPWGVAQVNDVYAATGATLAEDDRIEVRVLSGPGRIVPFATPVDNVTNDGTFVGGAAAATTVLLPAVANASGMFGAVFRTDVKVANVGATPIRVQASFIPFLGAPAAPVVVSLGIGETRLLPDILATLFGLPAPAAGAVKLVALDDARLVATSRTFAEANGGTFGLSYDPSEAGGQAAPGRKLALTFLSSSPDVRTNVGFVETSGVATSARVALYAADGSRLGAREVFVEPLTAVQWNDVFAAMGVTGPANGSAIVEVLSGGTLSAYSIALDNRTNDGSLVPAALLP